MQNRSYIPRAVMYIASAITLLNNGCVTAPYKVEERTQMDRVRANQPTSLERETWDEEPKREDRTIEIKPHQEKPRKETPQEDNSSPYERHRILRARYV